MPKPHRAICIYMMKKVLFMLAILTCIFASCSDGGSDEPSNPTPKPEEVKSEITLDNGIVTNGLSFGVAQGEQSVSFTTNTNWTLSIAATTGGSTWCKASATSGSKGTANVKFTVTENTDYDDRSVSVTIKAGTASKTFTITQKGADALLVTTKKYEVAQAGGKIEVEVKANIEYQLAISETAKDWIKETQSKSRTLTTKKHTFQIAENEEVEKREGEITIKSGDKVETVKVYQAGGAVLLLSKNEFTVSDAGETISVDIKSNVEYGVQMPDVNWIKDEASNRGMSSHTLKYVIAPNEGYDSRSAEIIFYGQNSDLKDTLKVVQAQKDAIVISEKNISVDKEGGTIEVKLSTNIDFEVEIPSDATWISQTKSRALVEKSFYLKISENTSDESRSANITITNKDSQVSDSIVIVQQGNIIVAKLNEAGTLKSTLGKDYLNINSLKIIGPINGDDVYYLRKMLAGTDFSENDRGKLATLDLSEASIVEGGEWYYELGGSQFYTSNNIIGDYMFKNCTNLCVILLPQNAISISNYAFQDCSALTIVSIGNNATSIGKGVFYGCTALTQIEIPDNVNSIGQSAFWGCTALTQIEIPDNVNSIGSAAFAGCSALTSINIPNNVNSIGDGAFHNCSSLASIKIPNNITSIEHHTFYGCSALTSINISDNINTIGSAAFAYCSALTSINIPDNINSIGSGAFAYCSALTSINIPNNVTTILNSTFEGCSTLSSIDIPNNVTTIGHFAFAKCSNLVAVTIGDSVTSIGQSVFAGCSALSSIKIPDNVTTIDRRAFEKCKNLISVTIGSAVTSINHQAFHDCPALAELYCHATTPPTIIIDTNNSTFDSNIKDKATLYVPLRCQTKYKSSNWGIYFTSIKEMD